MFNSYQRTPVTLLTTTEWFTVNASREPRLRYPSRYIRRSPNVSSTVVVPGCGMRVLAAVYALTEIDVGPANVELPGVTKFAVNFHRFRDVLVPLVNT